MNRLPSGSGTFSTRPFAKTCETSPLLSKRMSTLNANGTPVSDFPFAENALRHEPELGRQALG